MFRCSFRPEVASDVVSGAVVAQGCLGVPVKFCDSTQTVLVIYRREAVGCGIFDRFSNFNNSQLEVVSDVISGIADQDVGMDVCANSPYRPDDTRRVANLKLGPLRQTPEVISPTNFQLDPPH